MKTKLLLILNLLFTATIFISCIADSGQDNPNDPSNVKPLSDEESVAADKLSLSIGYNDSDNALNVTQNIILTTSGPNGTTISWSSNNTLIISNNGIVLRPGYLTGDTVVTITATITKNFASDTQTFVLTVIRAAETDADRVAQDKESLAIVYHSGDSASRVTENLTLPTSGSSGTTISWGSSNTSYISNTGIVTRPGYLVDSQVVTLTAIISRNAASDTRTFNLTVYRAEQTLQDRVDADTAALVIGYNGSDNVSNVTQDVTLSIAGSQGSTISWTSNNDTVINSTGVVTNPRWGSGTATVTLTATISQTGATSRQKIFSNLTVPAQHYIYLATGDGISISTNNGITWPLRKHIHLGGTIRAIYASGSRVYVTSGAFYLWISQDDGNNWTFSNYFNSMDPPSMSGVYGSGSYVYVGTSSNLFISADNGDSWTPSSTSLPYGYMFASGNNVYVASSIIPYGVYFSSNSGGSWTHYETSNGLGSNTVYDVFYSGTGYAATAGGVSIYNSYTNSWANYTTTNGLPSNTVYGVYVSGSDVFAATANGLARSTNGGVTYTTIYNTINGLGSNTVRRVIVIGSTIYAATSAGLSISINSGTSWTNYTTENGLGSNNIIDLMVQ